jgi:3-deoxy-D-manno-octulosonic-acid transferase
VLVAGSTLDGEESLLLGAWQHVVADEPEAIMILAPRRTERFAAAAALVESNGFTVIRASELRGRTDKIASGNVVLLDTIGDLASVYSLGMAAFVGGSLVQAGGHNPLEPARFAVPVVMGPSSENFREIVEAMRAAVAIRIVNADELANVLPEMLKGDPDVRAMGERGHDVFNAQAGATARTTETLLGLLNRSAA